MAPSPEMTAEQFKTEIIDPLLTSEAVEAELINRGYSTEERGAILSEIFSYLSTCPTDSFIDASSWYQSTAIGLAGGKATPINVLSVGASIALDFASLEEGQPRDNALN